MNAYAGGFIPHNERQRMAAVGRYDVLDTPPDGAFDRITAIAARRFRVPISVISIVDTDRIWFKSHHGLSAQEIGRDPGLCASAILSTEPYVLADASTDIRSLANPLVAGAFGLRFYAGAPLTTSDGYNLGTLCVIDRIPRSVDQAELDDLADLASVVIDQLELRLSARRAVAQAKLMAREIDHRVMNSLQFISGLLTMQSRAPGVTDAVGHLQAAATRVAAVARVHQNFQSDETEETSCLSFLRRLCVDLSSIVGRPIELTGDEGKILTTQIQPVGLLVNELVINAAKYGAGRIGVNVTMEGVTCTLEVRDDGQGLPADFAPHLSTGLGMKVMTSLAAQLGGPLVAGPNPDGRGSSFATSFPTA